MDTYISFGAKTYKQRVFSTHFLKFSPCNAPVVIVVIFFENHHNHKQQLLLIRVLPNRGKTLNSKKSMETKKTIYLQSGAEHTV